VRGLDKDVSNGPEAVIAAVDDIVSFTSKSGHERRAVAWSAQGQNMKCFEM